jgi:hypothetical protein
MDEELLKHLTEEELRRLDELLNYDCLPYEEVEEHINSVFEAVARLRAEKDTATAAERERCKAVARLNHIGNRECKKGGTVFQYAEDIEWAIDHQLLGENDG